MLNLDLTDIIYIYLLTYYNNNINFSISFYILYTFHNNPYIKFNYTKLFFKSIKTQLI